MSSSFGLPIFSQYKAQSIYSPFGQSLPLANTPFQSLFAASRGTQLLPMVIDQRTTSVPPQTESSSVSTMMMLLLMLLGRRNPQPVAEPSIVNSISQVQTPTVSQSSTTVTQPQNQPVKAVLMHRSLAGHSWKTDIDQVKGVFDNANLINQFFGSNAPNMNSEGGDKMEIFDQSGRKTLSLSYADFKANAQYFDTTANAWKPLGDKFASLNAMQSVGDKWNWDNTSPDRQLKIRYTDPNTKTEYDFDQRWLVHKSPVVLDTDGNGKIDLTSLKDGVQFDIDGDGKKEQVSWTQAKGDKTDAWLALDRNGNGQIDSGKELFGNQHGLANGYEELKKFDDNKDGVIDAKDAVYSKLKTWKDVNHDGVSQAGEMQDLKSTGVESIKLSYTESKEKDAFGNELRQQSAFTRTDDAAAKLAAEQGKSVASLKTGLAVDAWVNTLKAS